MSAVKVRSVGGPAALLAAIVLWCACAGDAAPQDGIVAPDAGQERLYFSDFALPDSADAGVDLPPADAVVSERPAPTALGHRTDHQLPACDTLRFAQQTAGERKACLAALVKGGYSHIYLAVARSEGDGWPEFDYYDKPELFRSRVEEARLRGLEPVIWIAAANEAANWGGKLYRYWVGALIDKIDDVASSYVLGELEQQPEGEKMLDSLEEVGGVVAGRTARPVGVSLGVGQLDEDGLPSWVDFVVLQYPDQASPATMTTLTRDATDKLGKPVVAGRYAQPSAADRLASGDAALEAGAVGFGHGGSPL